MNKGKAIKVQEFIDKWSHGWNPTFVTDLQSVIDEAITNRLQSGIKAKALRKKGTSYFYTWDDYNQRWMPQDKWFMQWSEDTQLTDFVDEPPTDAELVNIIILEDK